ncbi:MAG: efflux RND transporter permease subunit [Cyclobacteriaceae bacterium]|nr:efflux RND transporter permease subunit [Cyclobacteriaceae bacterium]
MWTKLAHFIIKFRLLLVIILAAITIFMAYMARDVTMSYSLFKAVPDDDPDALFYKNFRSEFGEDGNIVAIAIYDSAIYELNHFNRYKQLSEEIKAIEGVINVISLPLLHRLSKNQDAQKFDLEAIFNDISKNQQDLDSLLQVAQNQKFYSGQIINPENGSTLTLISINEEILNSEKRVGLTNKILEAGTQFTDDTGINVHYAGHPFVRSVMAGKVKDELVLFLALSILVTGLIMLLFFRSLSAVIFPMIIIAVVVIWVIGTLGIFGYKITILTGLIPPVIVVIGIPNSIYLLNMYHQEFGIHGNKMKAISRVVRKIGFVTLITNVTTSIGFLVLISTSIIELKEFGIVAGLNIMATFLVSIILIPSVFSWLPSPSARHLRHLKFKPLESVLDGMDVIVHRHKYKVFGVTILLLILSIPGMRKIESVQYIIDDIPKDDVIKKDLAFFEENFSGIMPLEIVIDTKKKRGVIDLKTLAKVEEFETFLDDQEDISKPVSVVSFIKAAKQAFYNNNPDRYELPNNRERSYILRYLRNQQSDEKGLINSFVDSTYTKMRISLKVADIGSVKMDSLVHQIIEPKIEEVFADNNFDIKVTGSTPLFVKGNKFLIQNLQFSLLLAFVVISIIMAMLFVNFRMIIISLIPNFIPLIITAGIMGYLGIHLKPSTALVFSIVFGISVDDSIHYLAKYRMELFASNFFVPLAVSKSIKETGASMIYTSIVLFAGFIIFTGSDFGGTIALGLLTSITLLIAMITNLILLPALLMTFDDGKRKKGAHPLIEQFDDGFYHEDEDEEIDLKAIKIEENNSKI